MLARPSSVTAAAVAGVAALFLSHILRGSDWEAHFEFINFARVFRHRWMPEWNEHHGVKVQRGVLNKTQCSALVHEVKLRASPNSGGGFDGLEHEATQELCRIPEAIDAARRILSATSYNFGKSDLRIDDLHVLRRRVPITRLELQQGPLPWLLFLTIYVLDFFIGDRVELLVGRDIYSRYRWSFNGNVPAADRCQYDAKSGKCTPDANVCCAWRTHSAILFLTDEEEGFFSGGDFVFLNPHSWYRWLWLQHWWSWVRVPAKCGTLVMFENRLEPAVVHSIVPIWSTSAGVAFEHAGRYTFNVWFTSLGDKDAEVAFRKLAIDRPRYSFKDFEAWPQHRCLSGHSWWHKSAGSLTQPAEAGGPFDVDDASGHVPIDPRTGEPQIFPLPVDYIPVQKAPPVAAPGPITKDKFQAGITALDHEGRKVSNLLPVNVPGGRKIPPAEVFREAIQYVEQHPNRALAILKSLAPAIGMSGLAVETVHDAEPFLLGVALQANLAAVRDQLRATKVIGADFADRKFGVSVLLLNTARAGREGDMEL